MTDGNIVDTNTDTTNTGANIQTFTHENHQLRTLLDGNGDPWFLAKDVCDAVGITNNRDAISQLDDDEKNTVAIADGTPGNPNKTIISEAGLYKLILRSRKPEAKQFQRWVTHDVLPSIRRHGVYATDTVVEKAVEDPDFMIGVLTRLKEERQRRAQAEQTLAQQAPKVKFADSVETARSSILIGELARDLRQNGVDIGQNRLFAWLRDHKYLIARKGESWNEPTQRALDMGLFQVKTRVLDNPDGSKRITRTTKVTGKGRVYFTNLLLDKNT